MLKQSKALLLPLLFSISSINSMDSVLNNFMPNDDSKKSSLIALCCAATALGLSYLGYKWIKQPTADNNAQKIIIPTTIEAPTKSVGTQIWIETSDNITLSINTKNYLPKCGLRYLLEQYKELFGYYNDSENPLKLGCSLYDLKLIQRASRYLKSQVTNFNFNAMQQASLLEMTSAFKMHKLYLALLNHYLPNDINTKKIAPYHRALTVNIPGLFDNLMAFIKKSTLTWQMWVKDCTFDCRYRVCPDNYHTYTWLWDNKFLAPIENAKYLPDHYRIFPRKNLVLFSGYNDENRPNEKYSTFIYDIENNKRYYLDVATEHAYIAISPDEKYIAITPNKTDLIYVLTINDLDNIQYSQPLKHKNITGIAFSPNNKFLASTGNGIKLWNPNKLDAKPKTLLPGINFNGPLVFNKDNEHVCTRISINVNKNKFKIATFNIHNPEKYKSTNICRYGHCEIFPNNSDFIIYMEHVSKEISPRYYTEENTLKIMDKHGNELFSQKYSKYLPTITISDNFQHIGMSTKENYYDSHILSNLITINKNSIYARTPNIEGKCTAINDDGSFFIDTEKRKIILYDATLKPITTSNYPTTYENSPHIRPIVFDDDIKQIKPILNNLTLTQYNFVQKACDPSRKKDSLLSIKANSFDHDVLKSFGTNEQYISNILKLEITS